MKDLLFAIVNMPLRCTYLLGYAIVLAARPGKTKQFVRHYKEHVEPDEDMPKPISNSSLLR